jgi:dTMP kinase
LEALLPKTPKTMIINPYPNPFIAIEGIDGSGKTLLLENFRKWDARNQIGAVFTKEPTDGDLGQQIRKILKGNEADIFPQELQELYIQDRLEHRKIETLFLKSYPVFSDRDFPSTLAYGIAEGLSAEWVLKKHEAILGNYFFVPNLIFILNLDPQEALARQKRAGKAFDHFEKELEVRIKIRQAYLDFPKIMEEVYPKIKLNIEIIDASPLPGELFKTALSFVKPLFDK